MPSAINYRSVVNLLRLALAYQVFFIYPLHGYYVQEYNIVPYIHSHFSAFELDYLTLEVLINLFFSF